MLSSITKRIFTEGFSLSPSSILRCSVSSISSFPPSTSSSVHSQLYSYGHRSYCNTSSRQNLNGDTVEVPKEDHAAGLNWTLNWSLNRDGIVAPQGLAWRNAETALMKDLIAKDDKGVKISLKNPNLTKIVEAGEEISFEEFDTEFALVTSSMSAADKKLYVTDGWLHISPNSGKIIASEIDVDELQKGSGNYITIGRIIADCPILNVEMTKTYVMRTMAESVPPPILMYLSREGKPFTGVCFDMTDGGDISGAIGVARGVNPKSAGKVLEKIMGEFLEQFNEQKKAGKISSNPMFPSS